MVENMFKCDNLFNKLFIVGLGGCDIKLTLVIDMYDLEDSQAGPHAPQQPAPPREPADEGKLVRLGNIMSITSQVPMQSGWLSPAIDPLNQMWSGMDCGIWHDFHVKSCSVGLLQSISE